MALPNRASENGDTELDQPILENGLNVGPVATSSPKAKTQWQCYYQ